MNETFKNKGITEYKLVDLLKFQNEPSEKELIYKPFEQFTGNETNKIAIDGEMNIFDKSTNRGVVIRYTNSRDWIRFVKYLVSENAGTDQDRIVVIIDCGYQFNRLFRNDPKVVVIEYVDPSYVEGVLQSLKRPVRCVVWSNVNIVRGGAGVGLCGGALAVRVEGVFV